MLTRRQIIHSSLFALGGFALGNPLLAKAASSKYGIVGHTAPELNLDYWIDKDGNSTSFSLAENKGKWIFLKCFQSWCPGCHSHGLPTIKKISDALKDNPKIAFAGIQTVFEGFDTNTVEKVRDIQLQYDLKIPMGHDPGSHNNSPLTMKNYRTGGTPWMILINPQRQVIYNEFGVDADQVIEFLQRQTA